MTIKNTNKSDKKMMNNATLKKPGLYKINLAKIDGEGTFPCPKCGTAISPDDESEEVYKIVETKVINDELTQLVISCNTCKTKIELTGFEQSMGLTDEE
ncbi:MAG TPA: hypothetical protein VMD05_04825 [Candidatus Nanoarchaeia archaeon]|nr:hypothetical protein [Candidatus Nanoarchaeia archaeon]